MTSPAAGIVSQFDHMLGFMKMMIQQAETVKQLQLQQAEASKRQAEAWKQVQFQQAEALKQLVRRLEFAREFSKI